MTIDLKKCGQLNRSPKRGGGYDWMCETCGKEWFEENSTLEEDVRLNDRTNWPVQCDECTAEFVKKCKEREAF